MSHIIGCVDWYLEHIHGRTPRRILVRVGLGLGVSVRVRIGMRVWVGFRVR